jgi:cellulose synthase/poly-beta-1,6-N-acetylglucosamine synthase-like glycosyltransferase
VQIPQPPNDKEKYLYVDQNKFWLLFLGFSSFILLTVGMLLFIRQHTYMWPYLLFVGLMAFYLGLSYFIGFFGSKFDLSRHKRTVKYWGNRFPTVDVYLPSCGEDTMILLNTMYHVSQLNYPKDKLSVYVLDDSKSAEQNQFLKSRAEHFGFTYVGRENKGELKKAGNIRYAFARTSGEFCLILDADFAPRPDMLTEMVPYMLADKRIAIVQSPQYFTILGDDPWVQKGAAYIQELFYRLIQVNRQTWNGSICVGTCALYRRSALAPHGGTAAIGYSEDVHTGFQAICDGFKIKYIPVNLSCGVCPDTPVAFLVQQYRWATGSFTLFLNRHFWFSGLPLMTKMTYLSGMLYYIATALGLFLVPLPCLVMLMFFPEKILYYNAVFSLPSFIYGTCAVALWSRAKWGLYAVQARQLSYWAHFLAIFDKLKNQTVGWIPTGDKNIKGGSAVIFGRFKNYYVGWNLLIFATTYSFLAYRVPDIGLHSAPAFFFTTFNLLVFLMTWKSVRL